MPRTQAVYYRDPHGREPVDDFLESLPAKQAAKIDEYQRSENLIVLLHAIEKNSGAVPRADIDLAIARMQDFRTRMDAQVRRPPRAAGADAPAVGRSRRW